jgi:hypothetical protein
MRSGKINQRRSNRTRKNNGQRSTRQQTMLYRTVDMEKVALINKQVNIQYSLYAVQNIALGVSFYSWSSSTSAGSPVIYQSMLIDLFAAAEFTYYAPQYALFRCKGVMIRPIPTSNLANMLDTPPVYLDLYLGGGVASVQPTGPARSDSSLELKINNVTSAGQSIYYLFPPVMEGSAGYSLPGRSSWQATTGTSAAGGLYLVQGYLNVPGFNITSSTFLRVAAVDVIFDVDFTMPSYFT